MTEIQKVKAEIKMLEKKLSFLEELEKTKSPVEEAYKKVYGVYPTNEITYNSMWGVFQKGYYAAQEDYKVGEYQEPEEQVSFVPKEIKELVKEDLKWCKEHPNESVEDYLTPKTPEQVKKLQEKDWDIKVETDYLTGKARHKWKIVDKDGNDYKPKPHTTEELFKPNWEPKPQNENEVAEGLSSAFREAVKQGVVSSVDKQKDDFMDKMVAELKGKTLEDIVTRWWCDTFSTHEKWSMEECIDDLIDQIHLWIPKEQSAEGSQNAYVESAVKGFNDAIQKIKSKLRNKK